MMQISKKLSQHYGLSQSDLELTKKSYIQEN